MSNSSDALFANVLKTKETASVPAVEPVVAPVAPVVDPDGNAPEVDAVPAQPTELDMLKNRARLMGVSFSNNIGLDALRAKIQAKLDGEAEKTVAAEPVVPATVTTEAAPAAPVKVKSLRQTLYDREMRLVRLRITNLDPKKKDLPGEIFCVANEVLGAVRKFIPYGEATDNGYHVPYCIYKQLKKREFLNIKVRKDSRGREHVETNMAREFALEILEPLTEKDLARLAAHQAAARGQE